MTRVIIIRHGSTAWNEQDKVQGHANEPLSKKGIGQAHRLGVRLAGEDIDALYTSELVRAIDTAKEVARHHLHLKITIDKRLNEMDWGEWEGLTFKQIEEKFPEEMQKRAKDKFTFAPKGGESPAVLKKRLIPFCKEVLKKHPKQTVVIVGHGGINRVLMGIFLGWKNEKIIETFTKNTSITILELEESRSKMHLFNCIAHLEK